MHFLTSRKAGRAARVILAAVLVTSVGCGRGRRFERVNRLSSVRERFLSAEGDTRLAVELPTLAEAFALSGYRTLAVTRGGYVGPSFGFDRGFDVYTVGLESTQARTSEALRLLDRYREEPTFLFFHTYQVHEYSPKSQSAQELFGSLSSLGPA